MDSTYAAVRLSGRCRDTWLRDIDFVRFFCSCGLL